MNIDTTSMYVLLKEVDKNTDDYEVYGQKLREIIWKLYFNIENSETRHRLVNELEKEVLHPLLQSEENL